MEKHPCFEASIVVVGYCECFERTHCPCRLLGGFRKHPTYLLVIETVWSGHAKYVIACGKYQECWNRSLVQCLAFSNDLCAELLDKLVQVMGSIVCCLTRFFGQCSSCFNTCYILHLHFNIGLKEDLTFQ